MSLEIFTTSALDQLMKVIGDYSKCLELYEDPVAYLDKLSLDLIHVPYEIDPAQLNLLIPSEGNTENKTDELNSPTVYSVFSKLTPAQATDERLWASLSLINFIDYTKKRWGAPSEDKIQTAVKLHWACAPTTQSLHRDNALSRLWWMGKAVSDAENMTPEDSARVLFNNSDYRAQVYERPGSTRYSNVRSAILRITKEDMAHRSVKYNVDNFRSFMKSVNYLAGKTNFGLLSEDQLIKKLSPLYQEAHKDAVDVPKKSKLKKVIEALKG